MTISKPTPSERPPEAGGRAAAAGRAMYEAIARERVVDALELVDPGIVIEEHPPLADAVALHGHAGLVRLLRVYSDAFGAHRLTIEEVAGTGDTALVGLRLEPDDGRRRHGPTALFHVVTFNGAGKASRIGVFNDRSDALAAAGLAG